MRVQHNIMAMNSYRNYNNNSSSINKNIEKLSSGYQINRAGDNAAGLAISEKMRAQITGLEVAQKNAKDGISLVQTAEGALTEVHSMLNRMYELAEQSANGTYSDEVDRFQLQKEVDSLKTEIDRIADSANFNGRKLLNGDLSAGGPSLTGEDGSAVEFTDNSNITAIDLTNSKAATDGADVKFGVMSNGDEAGAQVAVFVGETRYDATLTLDNLDESGNFASDTLELVKNGDAEDKITITLSDDGKTALKNAITADSEGAEAASFGYDDENAQITAETANSIGSVKAGAAAAADDTPATPTVLDPGGFEAAEGEANVKDIDFGDYSVTEDTAVNFSVTSGGENNATVTVTVGDKTFTTTLTAALTAGQDNTITLSDSDSNTIDVTFDSTGTGNVNSVISAFNDSSDIPSGEVGTLKAPKYATDDGNASLQDATETAPSNVLTLQIGDDSKPYNKMQVSIDDIHVNKLGSYTMSSTAGLSFKVTDASSNDAEAPKTIEDIDISSQKGAAEALNVIKEAINYVSDTRGGLGAIQNRLEHTINNLSVMQENMQDAESTIRDTDVAAEMMKYTKNSILVQSAQAMLAQANQQPQGVLQLLQ